MQCNIARFRKESSKYLYLETTWNEIDEFWYLFLRMTEAI